MDFFSLYFTLDDNESPKGRINIMTYTPPVDEMLWCLKHNAGLADIQKLEGCEEASDELINDIFDQSAKLARDVIAPLNFVGDQEGAVLNDDHSVKTATGFKEAYAQYCESGWNTLPFPEDFGGMHLPWVLSMAINEMWQSSNLSFGLCPLLNQGAVDAIEAYASDALKETYLPHMVAGDWTGTMNLTEPQAGSDLAAVKTKAEPVNGGEHYLLTGQKIFITFGEHDMAENIIHLVLARTPDAPEGVKGISLFLVPKFLVNDDGSLGERNDVKCVGLEHKLGIHGSPTCTMQYGDQGGAIGYLIGEENQGLPYMFKMMNNARLHVGLQGVSVAERAYQKAFEFANDRKQGRSFKGVNNAPIAHHADVQRMLWTMKTLTQAGRGLCYLAAAQMDMMARGGGDEIKQSASDLCALLTPIVKSWCTDMGNEVASLGVQVHGGMGFVEETGAAQYFRDARILPIYEGTNGIQAKDLVFRKILKEQAPALRPIMDSVLDLAEKIKSENEPLSSCLVQGVNLISRGVAYILERADNKDLNACEVASTSLLNLMAVVLGGYMIARSYYATLNDETVSAEFKQEKQNCANFYMTQIFPRSESYYRAVVTAGVLNDVIDSL